MSPRGSTFVMAVATILWLGAVAPAAASDDLNRARELYAAAEYDGALAVLNAATADPASADGLDILRYRALCLLALDRQDEARKAIGELVTAAPQFHLSENDAAPRVRAIFADVRKSLMPEIVQRAYAEARAAFDRKAPDAAARFDRVLALLQDPDVAGHPALADLATVAAGFRDLSALTATTSARTASPASGAPAARPGGAGAPSSSTSVTIVPPVAISQTMPPLIVREQREWNGEVEVIISEDGTVIAARMVKPIHPLYDVQLLKAARNWTYKPALKDGVPAQMAKVVAVHIDSRPPCTTRVTPSCRPVEGD